MDKKITGIDTRPSREINKERLAALAAQIPPFNLQAVVNGPGGLVEQRQAHLRYLETFGGIHESNLFPDDITMAELIRSESAQLREEIERRKKI